MARGELHIQLLIDYADDEKLADVSRGARLLYVDALCLAKRKLNDGILTPAQVDKLAYPDSPAKAKKQAAELTATGAWTWDNARNVYVIAAWLKRNKSRAQIEADRLAAEEASLKANHKRWHSDRRNRDPKCRLCTETGSTTGSATDPQPDPTQGERSESTETETETETKNLRGDLGGPLTGRTTRPPFPRCPKHRDRPADGNCGPCGDARRERTTWDRADAERARQQPQCPHHRGEPAHTCGRCRSEALAAKET